MITTQFFASSVALMSLLETIIAFVIAATSPEAVKSIEMLQQHRQELHRYLSYGER